MTSWRKRVTIHRVKKILTIAATALLLCAGCSEPDTPQVASNPAPNAAQQAEKTPEPSDAQKWLGTMQKSGYFVAHDAMEKSEGLSGETTAELIEVCTASTDLHERFAAALLLYCANQYTPVTILSDCAYGVLRDVDYNDEAFWAYIEQLSDRYYYKYNCYSMLFRPLALEERDDEAMAILRAIDEQCTAGETDALPGKAAMLNMLAPEIYLSPALFERSGKMFVQGNYFSNYFVLSNYYEGYFNTVETLDKAVALCDYIALEVQPHARAIRKYKGDMVRSVTREDGETYELYYTDAWLMNFELNAAQMPALDEIGTQKEGGPVEGRYVVLRKNTRSNEKHGLYSQYMDGRLTTLLPDEYRAASYAEADRIFFIETSYEFAFKYTNGTDGYRAVDAISVYDKQTGALLRRLETVTASPPEMRMVSGDLAYFLEDSDDYHVWWSIMEYLRALPWDPGEGATETD